jgi:hypothetical protein
MEIKKPLAFLKTISIIPAPYAPKRRWSFKRPIRCPSNAQVTTADIFIYEKPQRGDINKACVSTRKSENQQRCQKK